MQVFKERAELDMMSRSLNVRGMLNWGGGGVQEGHGPAGFPTIPALLDQVCSACWSTDLIQVIRVGQISWKTSRADQV